jgi:hypothetical protein
MSTGKEEVAFWAPANDVKPGITGNARWELDQAIRNPRLNAQLVVPAFVRLNLGKGRTVADVIRFLASNPDQYSLSDHEADALAAEAEFARKGADIHMVVLCNPSAVVTDQWTVLHVGPPQSRSFRCEGVYCGQVIPRQSGPLSCTPVMGIVDDGLGFLHRRFRKADGTTRFAALWIMHSGLLADDPGPVTGASVLYGINLTAADIDARLASGRSESWLYRQVNNGVFGPVPHKSTSHHAAHGSHVLDTAAGADPGDPMIDVPILGVQLPPSSIGDTSGRRLDPDIVLGLRWIITKALQRKDRAALVINLSLGTLAGPQDGTGLVEAAITAEIARYHFYSRAAPIRVVVAYGNARRARVVARAKLKPGRQVSLDWRILPDDTTSSQLELRTGHAAGGDIAIRLTPPSGGAPLNLPGFPPPNVVWQYMTSRGPVAEVALDPEPNFAKTLVTVAATIPDASLPPAPSGAWAVTLRNTGTKTRQVSLKVQRDDTPAGYRRMGRQSWLDHADAWVFEPETKGLTMPGPGSPVTREGSEVSYAGIAHPSAYFVSAARPDPFKKGAYRPSSYSAEGGLPLPASPTVAAHVDAGSALRGMLGIGVLTGSSARMSGTSMAAPRVTRGLLNWALQGQMTAQAVPNAPHDPAELKDILGVPPQPVADARMGVGTVVA